MKIPYKKGIICVICILCLIALIKYFHLTQYMSISYLHSHLQDLKHVIAHYYWLSVGSFIGCYILASACAIPGSSIFLTASGLLFGIIPGLIFSVIGATIGATLLFLSSRYLIGSWVQKTYAAKLVRFNDALAGHGHHYLLIMRGISLLPFCVFNLLAGLTLVPIKTFVWTTIIGMIPMAFVYVFTGQQLGMIDSLSAAHSPTVMAAFIGLIAFRVSLIPLLYRKIKKHKRGKRNTR